MGTSAHWPPPSGCSAAPPPKAACTPAPLYLGDELFYHITSRYNGGGVQAAFGGDAAEQPLGGRAPVASVSTSRQTSAHRCHSQTATNYNASQTQTLPIHSSRSGQNCIPRAKRSVTADSHVIAGSPTTRGSYWPSRSADGFQAVPQRSSHRDAIDTYSILRYDEPQYGGGTSRPPPKSLPIH